MDRFWAKVSKGVSCWEWNGCLTKDGYGRFWANGRVNSAHRIAYVLCVGEIPQGKELDHLCRNRKCVNPDHLEPVSTRANVLRGMGRGAMSARQTHCSAGHELIGTNLSVAAARQGKRRCRICFNAYIMKRYYARKS